MSKPHKVFVYGTLKNGFYFHKEYLSGDKSNFLGPALASLDYSLYIDGMPHLVKEKAEKPVKGELYEVDSEVLKRLDSLEEPAYYRELIEVTNSTGETLQVWAYLRPRFFRGHQFAWKEEEFT